MRVEIYMKPSCSLCDTAIHLLEDAQDVHGFELVEHNILQRDEWFARYRYRVPVVVIDGVEALELRFDAAALNQALRGTAHE